MNLNLKNILILFSLCLLLCGCGIIQNNPNKFEIKFDGNCNCSLYFKLYEDNELIVYSKEKNVTIKFSDSEFMGFGVAISENRINMSDIISDSSFIRKTDEDCDVYRYNFIDPSLNDAKFYLMKCSPNLYIIGTSEMDVTGFYYDDSSILYD